MKRTFSEFSTTNISTEQDIAAIASKRLVKEDAIKTYCRIRPDKSSTELFNISEDRTKISLLNDEKSTIKTFGYTKLFGQQCSQVDLFTEICIPVLNDIINLRKSGLIFTYGLTNSGKTYTVIGDTINAGILPLSLKYICDNQPDVRMTANYIEIYNEEVFDLLSESKNKKEKRKLNIKEKDKIFYVANLTEREINHAEDLVEALNEGVSKKIHASNNLNSYSSRSHTIFKVNLHYDEETISFSIVDLAGCERNSRTETNGKELLQACKINQSLSVLNKCFEALRYNTIYMNKKFVPFRESKLTMLFQEYFQGEQNISLVANITSLKDDYEETLRVLAYTSSIKEIKPVKSVIFIPKKKLAGNVSGFFESEESKIFAKSLNDEIGNIEEIAIGANNIVIDVLKEENNCLRKQIEELQDENEDTKEDLAFTQEVLEVTKRNFDVKLWKQRAEVVKKLTEENAKNSEFLKSLEKTSEPLVLSIKQKELSNMEVQTNNPPELFFEKNNFSVNGVIKKQETCIEKKEDFCLEGLVRPESNNVKVEASEVQETDTKGTTKGKKRGKYTKKKKVPEVIEEENQENDENDDGESTHYDVKSVKSTKSKKINKTNFLTDNESLNDSFENVLIINPEENLDSDEDVFKYHTKVKKTKKTKKKK